MRSQTCLPYFKTRQIISKGWEMAVSRFICSTGMEGVCTVYPQDLQMFYPEATDYTFPTFFRFLLTFNTKDHYDDNMEAIFGKTSQVLCILKIFKTLIFVIPQLCYSPFNVIILILKIYWSHKFWHVFLKDQKSMNLSLWHHNKNNLLLNICPFPLKYL